MQAGLLELRIFRFEQGMQLKKDKKGILNFNDFCVWICNLAVSGFCVNVCFQERFEEKRFNYCDLFTAIVGPLHVH